MPRSRLSRRLILTALTACASLSTDDRAARAANATPSAARPAASPCSGPEFHELDFWIGEWDAAWPASPGSPAGTGTNRIEKVLDGCVVSENFEASGPSPL